MTRVTRRSVLRSLAAGAAAATGGCALDTPHKESRSGPATTALQRLNVVVHGLCVVLVNPADPPRGIQLVIPTIKTSPSDPRNHVYEAGNLDKSVVGNLMLRNLKPLEENKQYYLKGVNPGSASTFAPALDLLFPASAHVSVNTSDTRRVVLPLPAACYPLALMRREKGDALLTIRPPYTGDENTFLNVVGTAQLLVYDSFSAVPSLYNETDGKDFGWSPNLDPAGVATLHIYQEPKQSVDSNHAIRAFKAMMARLTRDGRTMDQYYSFNPFKDNTMKDAGEIGSFTGIEGSDTKPLSWFPEGKAGEIANCILSIVLS